MIIITNMEKIIKIEQSLKSKIITHANIKWPDVSVVLFEMDGIRIYHKEYGKQTFINYKDI